MSHYLSEFPHYDHDAVYWACSARNQIGDLTKGELAVVDEFLDLCPILIAHGIG